LSSLGRSKGGSAGASALWKASSAGRLRHTAAAGAQTEIVTKPDVESESDRIQIVEMYVLVDVSHEISRKAFDRSILQ
jgi:hypothetical protein